MTFPIIPCGMWSGQGSTSAPNANAAGTTSAQIISPTTSNLANAYDGNGASYADIASGGLTIPGGTTVGTTFQQEVLYTHSPASGAIATSFVNIVIKARATYSLSGSKPPSFQCLVTASGNYSDATPVSSTSNPIYLVNLDATTIQANGNSAFGLFDGTVQIVFDGLSGAKTLDVNSLSLSVKWLYTAATLTGGTISGGAFSGTVDLRVYDISYIYL